MKRAVILRITLAFLLVGAITASRADVVDGFNYSTGPLSVVSGGQWRIWGNGTIDAEVVAQGNPPNAMRLDTSYGDVVAYSPQALLVGGSTALFFDFYVPADTINMGASVILGSGDAATNTMNYSSGGTIANLIVGYGNNQDGVDIHLWGTGFMGFPLVTTVTPAEWHQLALYVETAGSFRIFMDGVSVGAPSYSFAPLTDPNGLNAIELGSAHIEGAPDGAGYLLFDNVSLTGETAVPEPATVLLLGSVLAGLAGLRFRRQRR